MPSVARKGVVGKYIELPPALWESVVQLAEKNHRPVREEVVHALQRHLSAPPVCVYRVETPAIAPAEVTGQAEVEQQAEPEKKPRGRPRGSGKKKGG